MGFSTNSHGKKSDKETQSPMLRIFKDIMQKEKHNPEKANLIQNKKEERKEDRRRKHGCSKNKSERRSHDSSSSEQYKRTNAYKTTVVDQITGVDEGMTQSIPFQSDKRDSWLFYGQTEKNGKKTEDTFSCVSCALKKIASSEYACIGCLLVILTISIVVAFLVVCKNVPTLVASEKQTDVGGTLDSDRLKRKIEMLKRDATKDRVGLDSVHDFDKNHWNDDSAIQTNGLSEIAGSEFASSFRELNSLDDIDSKFTGDLDNILDNDKVNEIQDSARLRDFYRKLMQTDTQIRNLKKNYGNFDAELEAIEPSKRIKRSIKRFKNNHLKDERHVQRHKRLTNNTKEPFGFVIEKKKVLVQYKPLKKVPKCSHTPKDSNTHEKQLKHPFYKNTQRLDELLDTFLAKNLPEIMSDPFGLEKLFTSQKKKCKHPEALKQVKPIKQKTKPMQSDQVKYNNDDIMKIMKPESIADYKKVYDKDFNMFGIQKKNDKATTKSDYDVVLSVSTIMNSGINLMAKTTAPETFPKVPSMRRLMQLEGDDDENLGYEDLKEVLTDYADTHEEFYRASKDRKKHMEVPNIEQHKKPDPSGVHNPNWKGPMPLYPDELSAMIKQADIINKVDFPVSTKDIKSELEKTERGLNDIEYVEDYLNDKYDKLVRMAQAYSDYGVLDGKKSERTEKNSADDEKADKRIKLSINANVFKRDVSPRTKNNPYELKPNETINMLTKQNPFIPSEGIMFEFRPTSKTREDFFDIPNMLQHHLKFLHDNHIPSRNETGFDLNLDATAESDLSFIYNHSSDKPKEFSISDIGLEFYDIKPTQTVENINSSTLNDIMVPFGKSKRNLLSIDEDKVDSLEKEVNTENHDAKYRSNYTERYDMVTIYGITDETTSKHNSFEAYPITASENDQAFLNPGNFYNKTAAYNDHLITDVDFIDNVSNDNDNRKDQNLNKTFGNLITSQSTLVNDNKSTVNNLKSDGREVDYSDTFRFPLLLYYNDVGDKTNFRIERIVSNDDNITAANDEMIMYNQGTLTAAAYNEDNATNNNILTVEQNNDFSNKTIVKSSTAVNNDNGNDTRLSDFLLMISNWFAALDGFDFSQPKKSIQSNVTKSPINHTSFTEPIYPMYDSEMIDNIGHRSRVLMSVDSSSNGTTKSGTADESKGGEKTADVGNAESNVTKPAAKSNVTQGRDASKPTNNNDGNTKLNRTIVKRSADDSNLIFWNDMYDEEYGVEMNNLDNSVRDKHSVKDNGFIKKSGMWMQEKFNQLAQNLKKTTQITSEAETAKVVPKVVNSEKETYPKYVYDKIHDKIRKRQAATDEDDYDSNQKSIFAAMTNNMKEVCKKAAKAVQQAKNIQVREDNKQQTIATSLMQQLVRLMNDLVDYQVQQKTCARLPPDLQHFLEWLTSPEDERMESQSQSATLKTTYLDIIEDMDIGFGDDKLTDNQSPLFSTEKPAVDTKTQYMATLGDVTSLIRQYEAMSDEDKSKMTGVKKYLDDQLNYLKKRFSKYNDYNVYDTDPQVRFRRDLDSKKRFKRRLKRKLHKFIRNFGKKHTRTTASFYDGVQVTDYSKRTEKNNDNSHNNDDNNSVGNETRSNNAIYDKDSGDDMTRNGDNIKFVDADDTLNNHRHGISVSDIAKDTHKVKRNLKDVYYKAVQEAKRFTTVDLNMQTKIKKQDTFGVKGNT